MVRQHNVYLALIAGALCFASNAQAETLRIMTGPSGGAFYTLGSALSEIIEREVPGSSVTVQPGGSQANILAVSTGKAELGLTGSAAYGTAILGGAPFKEPVKDVVHLGTFWSQAWQLAVTEASGVQSIPDLKGKRIAVTTRGSVGESASRDVLSVYGLTYDDLASVEYIAGSAAVDGIKDGRLDGFSPVGPVPYNFHLDIATSIDARLIGVDADKIEELRKINPGYISVDVPGGTYRGVDQSVTTVGDTAMLVVSSELGAELVESIARAIAKPENVERLRTVMASLKGLTAEVFHDAAGMPRHPGAEKAAQ